MGSEAIAAPITLPGPSQAEPDPAPAQRLPPAPRQNTLLVPLGLALAATADPSGPMPMRVGPFHFVPSWKACMRAPPGLCQDTYGGPAASNTTAGWETRAPPARRPAPAPATPAP